MPEELEIIEYPDGTSSIKVVKSDRPCKEVSGPFEKAKGKVTSTKSIHNPGSQQGVQIKH